MAAATSSLPVPDSPVISTRASRRRDAVDHRAHLHDRRAVADHFAAQSEIGAQRSRFAPRLTQLERRRQREQHALGAQRLFEKIECAELRRFHGVAQSGATAHHHHRYVGQRFAHARQRRHPVQLSRHHEVEQQHVRLGLERARESRGSVVRVAHFVPLGAQQRADHAPNVRLVVDDQNARHRALRRRVRARETALLVGHELGREALRLGDALDLDGDRFDGLLDALEPRRHVGRLWRRQLWPAFPSARDRTNDRDAERDDD